MRKGERGGKEGKRGEGGMRGENVCGKRGKGREARVMKRHPA